MITRKVLSADRSYCYQLQRWWDESRPPVVFVMLNPVTADPQHEDPVLGRVTGFATAWGCGGVIVVSLFAFIATRPEHLAVADRVGIDTVGPRTDAYLVEAATAAAHASWPIVAAWGSGAPSHRVERVLSLPGMGRLQVLGVTPDGSPRHPLSVHAVAATPRPWLAAA